MLALDNRTPYSAERAVVLDKSGEKSWVVVVKGTWRVLPDGSTEPSAAPCPPLYTAEHFGEPGSSSIRCEADLIPSKPSTDVTLNAVAWAPSGRPVREITARMRVGSLEKRLRVVGDRHWERDLAGRLRMSDPVAFERMPVVYERAFGGWDRTDPDPSEQRLFPGNPIGAGFATRAEHLDGKPLPNVEVPDRPIASWDDRPPPGGFGALASYWEPRAPCAGSYDDVWMKDKFPLLPDDFDPLFYQCAPLDQRARGYLLGGEEVELENITESGSLRFVLPRVDLTFRTWFGRARRDHVATLQSVVIEPDVPQVILTWHTTLRCHAQLDDLDTTVIRERPR